MEEFWHPYGKVEDYSTFENDNFENNNSKINQNSGRNKSAQKS